MSKKKGHIVSNEWPERAHQNELKHYFKKLFKKKFNYITHFTNINNTFLRTLYLASLRIVKDGKPHTIGENLVLPAVKDTMKRVLGVLEF